MLAWCDKRLLSDTFFLLANRSIDPNLRQIAASYIVHYDYKEVGPIASVFIWIRPSTMWLRARWWWPRRDSCWTSSWGRTSSTSLGSQACTSWRSNFGLSSSSHFKECLFPFGVAYALQKDSPYTERYHWAMICLNFEPTPKVQQQDPAAEGVWPNNPLDPAGAGSCRSESRRRFWYKGTPLNFRYNFPQSIKINSNRIWSWWHISTLPRQHAARFCGLTRTSLFLSFSWTYFCDEWVNQCHVRISDDLYPVRNCDMGEVYTLVILKTKSLQDFTQLQVWGLLLAASFLLLLLELAADKVYFFFFFDPDHLTRCIENLKMLMARWTTDLKTIFTCTC